MTFTKEAETAAAVRLLIMSLMMLMNDHVDYEGGVIFTKEAEIAAAVRLLIVLIMSMMLMMLMIMKAKIIMMVMLMIKAMMRVKMDDKWQNFAKETKGNFLQNSNQNTKESIYNETHQSSGLQNYHNLVGKSALTKVLLLKCNNDV